MKGKLMNKMATCLIAGVIVAAAAAGCSVTVNDNDGGTSATGGTGGTGATGGTGGTGGTAGTGGSSGSGGASGSGGSGGAVDAGSDTPAVTCNGNPNDKCAYCAFTKCQMDHCACNAIMSCRVPMLAFYTCASAPNAKIDECAVTFAVNANPDASADGGGGRLAADLAECMVDNCDNTCLGLEAGTLRRDPSWKALIGR